MIKAKVNIEPEFSIGIIQSQFEFGRLYRCIATSEYHPKWLNAIVWKNRDTNSDFNLKRDCVYGVLNNSTELEVGSVSSGLMFCSDFRFVVLPYGSSIKLSMDNVLVVP